MGTKDEIVALLQEHDDGIFTFAYYSTYSIDDAKEITGEVFRKYAELRIKGKGVSDPEAAIYRLARNFAIRAVRGKGVETSDPAYQVDSLKEEDYITEQEGDPDLVKKRNEAIEASRQLTEEFRTVLILKELRNKEYEDIANIMGVDSDSAIALVSAARLSLGEALGMERIDEEKAGEQCQGYLPLLSSHVDGFLEQNEKELLDLHLKKCPFCRLVLEEMEKASEDYRSLIPLQSAVDVDDLVQEIVSMEMHEEALLPARKQETETEVAVGTGATQELENIAAQPQPGGRTVSMPDNLGIIITAVVALGFLIAVIVIGVQRLWVEFAIVLFVGIIAVGVGLFFSNEGFKGVIDQALEGFLDSFNTQSKWTIRDVSTDELSGIIASIGNVMARDGYMPQSQSPGFYTYFKQTQKRPSCLIAFILWFFCIVPAIIYLLRGSKIQMMTASVQFTRTSAGYTLNVKAPGGAKRRIRKVIEPYLAVHTLQP